MGGGGGSRGEVGWRWGKREIIYLSLHCHHQNDSCIKMRSDEIHLNVSLIVRVKVTRQRPQTTTFEERGQPKRNRTEVLLLPSLMIITPYHWAKPLHVIDHKPNALVLTIGSTVFGWQVTGVIALGVDHSKSEIATLE